MWPSQVSSLHLPHCSQALIPLSLTLSGASCLDAGLTSQRGELGGESESWSLTPRLWSLVHEWP